MRLRILSSLVFPIALTLLGGCNSGNGSASGLRTAGCRTAEKGGFCVVSCNLGCQLSTSGCAITEIAQNQPIELVFSEEVDPSSVSASTISIKTSSGEAPTGSFLVQGRKITFQPEVKLVGGATFFGFRANETYILDLPAGEDGLTLRSVSGNALSQPLTCALTVSRGIIDLDQQPPRATLKAPTKTCNVPQGVVIVVEFSELIDAGPFQGATSATSPVLYRIRRSRQAPKGSACPVECDPNAEALVLEGVPRIEVDTARRISIVTMKPAIALPGQVCVEVEVTRRVRDLAGTAAQPRIFRFTIESSGSQELKIVERFANDGQLDKDRSSGTWKAGARPGTIGGSGRLGDFDLTMGRSVGKNQFEWNTDDMTIQPTTSSLITQPTRVTDGLFEFANFVLAKGSKLILKGSKPARFLVRGKVEINGEIVSNGADTAAWSPRTTTGQPGGIGGAGGGRGGNGGDQGDDKQNLARFNGQDGENVRLLANHPYAGNAAGTGGKGSHQYPVDGKSVTFNGLSCFFSAQIAAGGGGGGFLTAGQTGRAVATTPPGSGCRPPAPELGPPAPGGKKMELFPVPKLPAGFTTLDFFLVGGSGGGGGGTHPFFRTKGAVSEKWRSGAGGAGGGGAVGFRAGGPLEMSDSGVIECKGGSGAGGVLAPPPAPGGGGSGGSVILQTGDRPTMGGLIDVGGGKGGWTNDTQVFKVETRAGDGAPGFIRLEAPTAPSVGQLGRTNPPATSQNVGKLADSDIVTGQQSLWYPSRQVFPPQWLRYEIEAEIDGRKVLFSDDPKRGPLATDGQPIRFYIQGAKVDSNGQPDSKSIKPWRQAVGSQGPGRSLNQDAATGFRFLLLYDKSKARSILVKSVTVVFRS